MGTLTFRNWQARSQPIIGYIGVLEFVKSRFVCPPRLRPSKVQMSHSNFRCIASVKGER